ncbi:glucans biosynthesis glucosyltransferase MdoH [Thioclava sp. BHET1]|uniref:Glucans biosynthesis glucosyltransferase H n=1 Tax=Thioclava dalianensis TaxID=1185766 RepID=A0A074TLG5_9RHOB|nr:glucans biosynthesis glucosyltransferase MdoH [Thioclava dalianensis]KEP69823.1 glucosyltransferase [Thioclava dalianensis]TMV94912.1 glucans biosynthesis glucosyltransferase MdoH [Thioclava sp. BHET1]SFM86831.1 membrane glycosyltransferase [Thioclava dalianensis]
MDWLARPRGATLIALRALALGLAAMAGLGAFVLFLQFGEADGLQTLDVVRAVLILISTLWLAWGAVQALIGLTTLPNPPRIDPSKPIEGRTAVLVPVYNEDPISTFSRVAAMDASLDATGDAARVDFAILSDTRNEEIAAREAAVFAHLVEERDAVGRFFYRRRLNNIGKKAGNIEDFMTRSGGAYDYALILDADSLMEGETILTMIRRIEAEPDIGLLQSLPRVIRGRSRFARAMQFSAAFFSPVFARGLAMLQGRTGPFWGHNAIVRTRAFAESCGLPALRGQPPFGGHVMSHDYVEAALLARKGWRVRLDDDLEGSFEEGPENIIDHAKRDRRWCQGNLQHARIIGAPGLCGWSRFVFAQGIMAYIAPLFWLGFIAASVAAPLFVPAPDYFPEPYWPFPYFPPSEASKAIGLAIGIFGLLLVPKLLIAGRAALLGHARNFGGPTMGFASTLAELAFSSLTAPVLLAFATRSVCQVVLGRDGGWPTNNRGDGRLSVNEGFAASWWIVAIGLGGLVLTYIFSPGLLLWLLPVGLPMLAAPWLISWSSQTSRSALMTVPSEVELPPVVALHNRILSRWDNAFPAPDAALSSDSSDSRRSPAHA